MSRLVWKTITCVPESEGLRRVRDNHPISAESCSSSAGHPKLFRSLGLPPRKFLKQGQFSVRLESRNTPFTDTPLLKGFWSKASWWGGGSCYYTGSDNGGYSHSEPVDCKHFI